MREFRPSDEQAILFVSPSEDQSKEKLEMK